MQQVLVTRQEKELMKLAKISITVADNQGDQNYLGGVEIDHSR
jgi:hypothetical protein